MLLLCGCVQSCPHLPLVQPWLVRTYDPACCCLVRSLLLPLNPRRSSGENRVASFCVHKIFAKVWRFVIRISPRANFLLLPNRIQIRLIYLQLFFLNLFRVCLAKSFFYIWWYFTHFPAGFVIFWGWESTSLHSVAVGLLHLLDTVNALYYLKSAGNDN